MNTEIKFKNLDDLYKRIFPALKSKVKEIHFEGYNYITEEDVWEYLKNSKWLQSYNLDLGSMVDDIFKADIRKLNEYVVGNYRNFNRNIQGDEK